MSDFSTDWPHGWHTRDGFEKFSHFIGHTEKGGVVFEGYRGTLWVRSRDGRLFDYGDDGKDIINAPAPKPEPRKWWVVQYRIATRGTVLSECFNYEAHAQSFMDRHDVVPVAFTCITEGDGLEGKQ